MQNPWPNLVGEINDPKWEQSDVFEPPLLNRCSETVGREVRSFAEVDQSGRGLSGGSNSLILASASCLLLDTCASPIPIRGFVDGSTGSLSIRGVGATVGSILSGGMGLRRQNRKCMAACFVMR
jgi:hypothetical protein